LRGGGGSTAENYVAQDIAKSSGQYIRWKKGEEKKAADASRPQRGAESCGRGKNLKEGRDPYRSFERSEKIAACFKVGKERKQPQMEERKHPLSNVS